MIERLEVTAGPGTVIRYGSVVAWAAPSASVGLISFLAVSARNLSASPAGGQQLADHLAAVLQDRDPEPDVPFAVVGPSPDGWAALLHGPVQVWDGARWITPEPAPGWMLCPLWPAPTLAVTPSGASIPAVAPDSVSDLEAGVVPGGGFVLIPARTAAPGTWPGQPETDRPAERDAGEAAATPAPEGPAVPAGAELLGGGEPAPGATATDAGGPAGTPPGPSPEGGSALPGGFPLPAGGPARHAPAAGPVSGPAPAGVVDLRSDLVRSRVVAYPPLPAGGTPGRAVPGSPVVAGVVCRRGHLNRPGMPACVRCDTPITDQDAYNVSGTRPALGCLVVDDGSVYRLDSGYLVGAEPLRDPTVRGGLARPLRLEGVQVAESHAEIRLHDWDVVVTDRDSPGGTFMYGPDSTAWEKLRPYQPRVLQPGTHLAFGQRVATFLTPWVTGSRAGGGEAPAGTGTDLR